MDADDPISFDAASLEDLFGQVWHGDCAKGMAAVPDKSVDMVFDDPPFNIGYKYDVYDDAKTFEAYMAERRADVAEFARVLKPTGSFVLAIGDAMAADLDVMVRREFGFYRRSWVVWYYTFGQNSVGGLSKSHTHILYYTRSKSRFKFNASEVRIPSWRQLAGDKRAHPDGRLPDDTWVIRPLDYDLFESGGDTWQCPRIAGTFNSRLPVATMMPEQVVGRVVRLLTDPGDVVMDPHSGSGTTVAVCKKLGRRGFGFELSLDYALVARLRVDSCKEGDQLDTPNIQEVPGANETEGPPERRHRREPAQGGDGETADAAGATADAGVLLGRRAGDGDCPPRRRAPKGRA